MRKLHNYAETPKLYDESHDHIILQPGIHIQSSTFGPFVGVDHKLWPTVADTFKYRVLRGPVVVDCYRAM